MKNKVLVKLAQTRLAINHVLRQRMKKCATSGAEYSQPRGAFLEEPTSSLEESTSPPKYYLCRPDARAYEEGVFLPDEGVFTPGQPYRPFGWKDDINTKDPEYQRLYFNDVVGPMYNNALKRLNDYQYKKYDQWNEARDRAAFGVAPSRRAQVLEDFDKLNPKPPKPVPISEDKYMAAPYKFNGNRAIYPEKWRAVK